MQDGMRRSRELVSLSAYLSGLSAIKEASFDLNSFACRIASDSSYQIHQQFVQSALVYRRRAFWRLEQDRTRSRSRLLRGEAFSVIVG